jgi:hypothetical protein
LGLSCTVAQWPLGQSVIRAIESGEPEEARSIMEKSLAAAARYWERTAPDELKQPVAWINSDR